jgi:hypothetical protein
VCSTVERIRLELRPVLTAAPRWSSYPPDGHVVRTRIISDSTHDAGLQACVQNAIRGWRYPRPDGGDVEVDYPLRFGTTTR